MTEAVVVETKHFKSTRPRLAAWATLSVIILRSQDILEAAPPAGCSSPGGSSDRPGLCSEVLGHQGVSN